MPRTHLFWASTAAAALPACLSVCPSCCWLHKLWLASLHRNTEPSQCRLAVWEKKCLSWFSWAGASCFINTHYRVWQKAEFSCSKTEITWWEFQNQEDTSPDPDHVVIPGMGDWPASVTFLLIGRTSPSIPWEMFGGNILRRLLATFPSLFGLLLQVLQQEGSIWHRVGTLRFSLHWRKLMLQFEMGKSKQIQSLRPTYSFSYLSHKSPSCWYGQCINSEYPVWLMPIFCHSCIII